MRNIRIVFLSGIIMSLVGVFITGVDFIVGYNIGEYVAMIISCFLLGVFLAVFLNKSLGTDIRADEPRVRLRNVFLSCFILWATLIFWSGSESLFYSGLFEKDVLWITLTFITLPVVVLGFFLYKKRYILGPIVSIILAIFAFGLGEQLDILGCGGLICVSLFDFVLASFGFY